MISKLKKGFTLLEIILVITLISILLGIVLISVNPSNIISEAQDNKREADALTLYQALEQYALKNNAYPEAIKNMPDNGSIYICKTNAPSCNSSGQVNLSSILVPTYMSKIPEYSTDVNNSGFYVVKDSNGKIGIGGIRQADTTTFIKGLESQSFATVPTPPIVTNGLILNLDASNPASYPGTGTTWTDLSGNGNNGTLVNGVSYNSANGGSLVFNGGNSIVRVIQQNGLSPNFFTTESWVKLRVQQSSRIFIASFSESQSGHACGINDGANNNIKFFTSNNNSFGYDSINQIGVLNTEQWYNVVCTYNGSQKKIYLNGENNNSSNYNQSIGYIGNDFTIGGLDWFGGVIQSLDGNIAVTRLYNRALTDSEIQQNFNAIRGRFGL